MHYFGTLLINMGYKLIHIGMFDVFMQARHYRQWSPKVLLLRRRLDGEPRLSANIGRVNNGPNEGDTYLFLGYGGRVDKKKCG